MVSLQFTGEIVKFCWAQTIGLYTLYQRAGESASGNEEIRH